MLKAICGKMRMATTKVALTLFLLSAYTRKEVMAVGSDTMNAA